MTIYLHVKFVDLKSACETINLSCVIVSLHIYLYYINVHNAMRSMVFLHKVSSCWEKLFIHFPASPFYKNILFYGSSHLGFMILYKINILKRPIQWLFIYSLVSSKFLYFPEKYFLYFPEKYLLICPYGSNKTLSSGGCHLGFPINK